MAVAVRSGSTVFVCALLGLLALSVPAAQSRSNVSPRPIDWDALSAEALDLLQQYIRINTTNPPGNELAGARFLQQVLAKEGLESQILDTEELGAGRANLYARLRSDGSKKAIALVHHIDVVPADPQIWAVDPFAGIEKDGYIWGRGALDMKGQGIVHIAALLALKRSGLPPNRDIVFLATSDEENCSACGAAVFVKRHPDLLQDVEYLITEGGNSRVENGRLIHYSVAAAEKLNLSQRLTVKGTSSHASRPNKDNPVLALLSALNRVVQFESPLVVGALVEKYFRDIAPMYAGEQRRWLSDIRSALSDERARAWILNDPDWHASLRNTAQITVLTASNKTNTVPAEASAEIDIRLLPGEDPATYLTTLKNAVADPRVIWTQLAVRKPSLTSPVDTDFFRAFERAARERDPGAIVTPVLNLGGTDLPWYRQLGITAYGIDPLRLDKTERQRGLHGTDERIPVKSLGAGIRLLYNTLRDLD